MRGIINQINAAIQEAGERYGISAGLARTIIIAPYVILFIFTFFMSIRPTQDFTERLTHENFPVELTSIFTGLCGGILGLSLAWRARKHGEQNFVVLFYTVFSLGLLWMAGEMNAWGQNFFGYSTPAWLNRINAQHMITLHNIEGMHGHNHWLRLSFSVGGLIGIALNRSPRYRKIGAATILFSWFILVVIKCGFDFWVKNWPIETSYNWLLFNWIINRISKVAKMMVAISGFLYVCLNWRMLNAEWRARAATQ
jgi:hypothetical protein